ncbi:MAG: hypothetical protein MI807_16015 [Verrucomicrobiales bacterium]|nr:hypothetical protein [Verrucomicrobiales bacterium]
MIRIPFSAASGSEKEPSGFSRHPRPTGERKSTEEIDARISLLESKLASHAEELKENVTERVDRIESRFHRALVSLGSPEGEEEEKVVEFKSDAVTLHHLPATAALSCLNELNDTLQLTRDHVDALEESVDRMRRIARRA